MRVGEREMTVQQCMTHKQPICKVPEAQPIFKVNFMF